MHPSRSYTFFSSFLPKEESFNSYFSLFWLRFFNVKLRMLCSPSPSRSPHPFYHLYFVFFHFRSPILSYPLCFSSSLKCYCFSWWFFNKQNYLLHFTLVIPSSLKYLSTSSPSFQFSSFIMKFHLSSVGITFGSINCNLLTAYYRWNCFTTIIGSLLFAFKGFKLGSETVLSDKWGEMLAGIKTCEVLWSNDWGEPAVSYQWTGWVWEITG